MKNEKSSPEHLVYDWLVSHKMAHTYEGTSMRQSSCGSWLRQESGRAISIFSAKIDGLHRMIVVVPKVCTKRFTQKNEEKQIENGGISR